MISRYTHTHTLSLSLSLSLCQNCSGIQAATFWLIIVGSLAGMARTVEAQIPDPQALQDFIDAQTGVNQMSVRRYHRQPSLNHDNIRCAFNHEDGNGNKEILVVQSNYGVWDAEPSTQITGAFNPSVIAFPKPDRELGLFTLERQPGDLFSQLSTTTYLLPKREPFTEPFATKADRDLLQQNSPNPFRSETIIRVRTGTEGRVRLTVHDLLGRNLAVLSEGDLAIGEHAFRLDGTSLAPGTYICRLVTENSIRTTLMTRLK